jgi:hypothetical protein
MPKRIVHDDVLSPMMILESLMEYTTSVADNSIPENRGQFDAILCRRHNEAAPEHQQKTAKYFAESVHSLRVSQKFSNIKGKLKDAGIPIHLSLPRRTRSFGEKQIAKLEGNAQWAAFMKLNKAAGNKSNK